MSKVMSMFFVILLSVFLCSTTSASTVSYSPLDSLTTDSVPQNYFGSNTLFVMALSEIEHGNIDSADDLFMESFMIGSQNVGMVKEYVRSLIANGYPEHVPAITNPFIELGYIDYELAMIRISIFNKYGSYKQLLSEINDMLMLFPESHEILLIKAETFLNMGEYEQSVVLCESGLEQYPELTQDFYLCILRASVKSGIDAQELFLEAISHNPESKVLIELYLNYLVSVDKSYDAFDFADLKDLSLAKPTWEYLVVSILIMNNKLDIAFNVMEERFNDGKLSPESCKVFASFHIEKNNHDLALEIASDLLMNYPDNQEFIALMGTILLSKGDFLKSIETLEPLVKSQDLTFNIIWDLIEARTKLCPDILNFNLNSMELTEHRQTIRELLSLSLTLNKRVEPNENIYVGIMFQSIGEYRKSIYPLELAVNDPRYSRTALLALSTAYQKLSNSEMNILILEAASEKFIDDPVILNALGYSLAVADKDLSRAESLVSAALDIDSDNPAYLDSIGWVYFKQELYMKAFDYLVQASNGLQDDPTILEHLGRCLIKMGSPNKALPVIQRAIQAGGDFEVLNNIIDEIEGIQ
jgi:tetratricopeptide (TPR) repeat protein